MESMHNILNRYIKRDGRFGVNETIARYMLAYLEELPMMKLAEVAEGCHVSTPSVIRFCREIGFQDFSDFKQHVRASRQEKMQQRMGANVINFATDDDDAYKTFVGQWTEEIKNQGFQALLALDRERAEQLAADILHYRYVYCFGQALSGLFGEYLRMRLSYQDKTLISMASINYDVALTPQKENTLCIVVSQHNRYLFDAPKMLPYLRENSDKVWLITQEPPHTSFQNEVDDTLFVLGNDRIPMECYTVLNVAEVVGQYCWKLDNIKE